MLIASGAQSYGSRSHFLLLFRAVVLACSASHVFHMRNAESEFHVKWKDKSYIHCTWVSQADVQTAIKVCPSLSLMVLIIRYIIQTLPKPDLRLLTSAS